MPFRPVSLLEKTLHGWLHLSPVRHGHRFSQRLRRWFDSLFVPATKTAKNPPKAFFRKLEKRRVFSVDAFFAGGILSIEITSAGQTNANLIANGTDFFVDANDNLTFEFGELRGEIVDLEAVHVFSNDAVGKFFWSGYFADAPLDIALATGDVVRTEGIRDVRIDANINAAGNVSLQALDTIQLNCPASIMGNLSIDSPTASINDGPNANITVAADATIRSNNAILLANEAGETWKVAGTTTVESQNSVELGLSGQWNSNILNAECSELSLRDQDAVSLQRIVVTGNVQISALSRQGAITDAIGSVISADSMTLNAGESIVLADNASDSIAITNRLFMNAAKDISIDSPGIANFGSVGFSAGDVSIHEDSATLLDGSIANALRIHSQTEVAQSGLDTGASFSGLKVMGPTFVSLLDSPGRVDLQRAQGSGLLMNNLIDGPVTADGINGDFFLRNNSRSASIGLLLGSFQELTIWHTRANIELQNQSYQVAGELNLIAGADVSNFVLIDNNPINRIINPSATITDLGSNIDVANHARFTSASSIRLNDSVNESLTVTNGTASFVSLGGANIALGGDGTTRVSQLGFHSQGISDGRLGDVVLQLDASISLANPALSSPDERELGIVANNIQIDVSGSMVNAPNTQLLANGSFTITASGDITLASNTADSLQVIGESRFESTTGNVTLGTSGSLQLQDVTLQANQGDVRVGGVGNSQLGLISSSAINIFIQEDQTLTLANITASNQLSLSSIATISDTASSRILANSIVMNAVDSIQLSDSPSNTLIAAGLSSFHSATGEIEIGSFGTVQLGNVDFKADQSVIHIGGLGSSQLGYVTASAIDIFIQEDSALDVTSIVAARTATLASSASIINRTALGIVAPVLNVDAGSFAHLGKISVDRLLANVGGNGTLNASGLFTLNTLADLEGQQYLNALQNDLPLNVSLSEQLLSGETLTQLRARASYIQSFGSQYGLFVQNDRQLTIDGVNAFGDGIHTLIETPLGQNLVIAGNILQQYTQANPGGMVLIAGAQLQFGTGVTLEIVDASLDASTRRVVAQPTFGAGAFDGGQGPDGYKSTRDVLYASDAFADSGTQNVRQRVSTEFGNAGESGFQAIVRYVDGSSQLFDTAQEVFASTLVNGVSSGVIQSHMQQTGQAAVFQRIVPFDDSVLASFQTLPTNALFRRSSEFFLFEQGGQVDTAAGKVELLPSVDFIDDVYSPGRKISLPLPTDIVVTPPLLVAPIRVAPNIETTYPMINNDTPGNTIAEDVFEVFIIRVGFDDTDDDGQPSDRELPTREEIQVSNLTETSNQPNQSIASSGESSAASKPAPGQPYLATKEVFGTAAPTAAEIQSWVDEYRNDPTKPAGAYAVVSIDNVTGAKVLKVFGVRDFEEATIASTEILDRNPNSSTSDSGNKHPITPETNEDASEDALNVPEPNKASGDTK